MTAAIQLLRPINCFMVALAVLVGALIAGGFAGVEIHIWSLGLACVVAFIFTGAGNSLNDYYDRKIDRINHPERPIPSGRIRPEFALNLAIILFFIALVIAYFINYIAFTIVVANLIVMVSYEVIFKVRGLAGNLNISWLTGTTFLFGGAAVLMVERTIILAVLAFLATLGREIAKDIEDIGGDIGRYTLPMKMGIKNAGSVASISLAIAVALSPLPILLKLFSSQGIIYYLPAIIVADAIFIYCISLLVRGKAGASNTLKGAMLVALMAFLAGGIL
jgi:geranylgeranylglycerol-phosphate geranylgeranyltransferase